MPNEPAAVGAQIASAQTTETDFDSAARDARIEVAPLSQATERHTPAAAIVEDTAMAPWLLSTDDPRQNANETGELGAERRSEQAALDAAEAAAAKAQAQARARAAAAAKAKAEAEAKAKAKAKAAARAKARENALASLHGSGDDGGGGNSKADGKGKGGSSGEGGRD
jgi:colicin import membrane protein